VQYTGEFTGGAAGGSSFVDGPGVSNGRTVAGDGGHAGGKDDPVYQPGIGDAGNHGQVVLQWTEFTLAPGGPPDVELTPGGPVRYPGIRVSSRAQLAPVPVTVTLPAGRKLRFGTPTLADHQLTLQKADGTTTVRMGTPSEDGTSLTFTDVDLRLPGTTTMWVAVSAGQNARAGLTDLTFSVADETSASTAILVKAAFTVTPGGEPRTLKRGGMLRYPGVQIRNEGSQDIPRQTITVTLPDTSGLHFGTPSNPDQQLTVCNSRENSTVHMGTPSADGRSLTFSGVHLKADAPGAQSVMWIGVSAADNAPTGTTHAVFTIGDHITCPSTTLNVT
jgi:hypothetical protein